MIHMLNCVPAVIKDINVKVFNPIQAQMKQDI